MIAHSAQGWESGRLDGSGVQADRHGRHEDRRLQQPRQVRHRVLRTVLRRQLIARQVRVDRGQARQGDIATSHSLFPSFICHLHIIFNSSSNSLHSPCINLEL